MALFARKLLLLLSPRGRTGLSNAQTGRHLFGVRGLSRARLKAKLEIHITTVSGLFVEAVASTGVFFSDPPTRDDWI